MKLIDRIRLVEEVSQTGGRSISLVPNQAEDIPGL